jgi:hypothetical protein
VDRLDGYRVDDLDLQVTKAISKSFGQQIWRRGIVVLTHAQLSPPDELRYADFVDRRSAILQAVVRKAAGFKKSETQVIICIVYILLTEFEFACFRYMNNFVRVNIG